MTTTHFNLFTSGALMMAFLTIGSIFFRVWKKRAESLFAVFAAAFWILSLERILLLVTAGPGGQPDELRPYVYIARLWAFLLISLGVVLKNAKRG